MSFQPSELAKPRSSCFGRFSGSAHQVPGRLGHTALPAVIPAFLLRALIMKQPDLGTALVCLALTAAILYTPECA